MSGKKLLAGVIVMGMVAPAILFLFLPMDTPIHFMQASIICFLSWCVATMAGKVLTRPRIATPSSPRELADLARNDK